MVGRRLHDISQTDRRDRSLRRGSRGSTVTRTCQATGETVLVPPRNRWSRVGHITGETGKVADDETVEDGLVVAKNRSNVRGAKEPCCNATPVAEGRQGRMIKTPSSLQDLKSGDIRQGEDGGGRSECGVETGRFARIEGASDWRHRISFAVKRAGEPSAGNRHARFDVAGAGNGLTVQLVRHSQRKRGANG